MNKLPTIGRGDDMIRIEKTLNELRERIAAPLAIELWNGRRIQLAEPATVTVRLPSPHVAFKLLDADLAQLGEAYVEGKIDVDGPIRDVVRAAEALAKRGESYRPGRLPEPRNLHSKRRDTEAIRYHYDVSNDFYGLWLDREMVYSCAYFERGDEDIDTAQVAKLDLVCRKLRLAPGERFLDIGCGWGALVRWAARHYGVDATGITLSKQQHELADARIRAEGLSDRCRVLLCDYRDLPGEANYDKIASVGMFEHVGLKNLPLYFGVIRRQLRKGGVVLNHGITSADPESREIGFGGGAFISRYVFPHGELPHLSLVLKTMAEQGIEVMDVETLRLHYARTLSIWSERFERVLERAQALSDARRVRIWRIYLAGCAHAFEQHWVSIQQVLGVAESRPDVPVLPWTRADLYTPGGAARRGPRARPLVISCAEPGLDLVSH